MRLEHTENTALTARTLIGNKLVTTSVKQVVSTVVETKVEHVKHAFYSAQAARLCGTCLYRTIDGRTIEITCVGDSYDWHIKNYNWPDKVYLGLVTDCLRARQGGRLYNDYYSFDSHQRNPYKFR